MASFFNKLFSKKKKETLDTGLEKTKDGIWNKITHAVAGKNKVDEDVLDNIEEALMTSDIGVETSIAIIEKLEERVARDKYVTMDELRNFLYEETASMLAKCEDVDDSLDFKLPPHEGVYVILVVGVNGVGKTTTIGKLAHQYKEAGYKVVLGAADTYRAAAVDQLDIWAERVGVPIVKQKMGSDPAAVAYDTVQSAIAQDADVVIIDTAGRLHNKVGLMNELTKVKRSIAKLAPTAPQEVLLVLDGSTGQNAIEQARQFSAATEVTTLAVTKLDGTSKGGVVIGISNELNIPVKYIGLGEGMADIQIFHPIEFVRSLFGNSI